MLLGVMVSLLELDIGNTRIKWRCSSSGGRVRGFLVWADFESVEDCLRLLLVDVEGAGCAQIEEVRVANVSGAATADCLRELTLQRWGVDPVFAVVTESAAGVSNGYDAIERLGVDRWLAVLAGAKNDEVQRAGACVVLDCGSAITADVLVANRFEGGYIVPGLRLMREALFGNTAQVKVVANSSLPASGLSLGVNTDEAVRLGLPMMVIGLVRELLERMRLEYSLSSIGLMLTGGDVSVIQSALQGLEVDGVTVEVMHKEELVLDGLAYAQCDVLC